MADLYRRTQDEEAQVRRISQEAPGARFIALDGGDTRQERVAALLIRALRAEVGDAGEMNEAVKECHFLGISADS